MNTSNHNSETMSKIKEYILSNLDSAEYIFDEDLDGESLSQVLALNELEAVKECLDRHIMFVFGLDLEEEESEEDSAEGERIMQMVNSVFSEGAEIVRKSEGEGEPDWRGEKDYSNALRKAYRHIRQKLL